MPQVFPAFLAPILAAPARLASCRPLFPAANASAKKKPPLPETCRGRGGALAARPPWGAGRGLILFWISWGGLWAFQAGLRRALGFAALGGSVLGLDLGEIPGGGLNHQPVLQALGAHPDPHGPAVDLVPHRLEVGPPDLLGLVVGVGDVMAILRGLAAKLANSGHCPDLLGSSVEIRLWGRNLFI